MRASMLTDAQSLIVSELRSEMSLLCPARDVDPFPRACSGSSARHDGINLSDDVSLWQNNRLTKLREPQEKCNAPHSLSPNCAKL